MIGRLLTALELEIVQLHSDRLLALGFPVNVEACLEDDVFNQFPHDWQQVVLADMQFMQDEASKTPGTTHCTANHVSS